jgi:hypothetical protein
MDETMPPDSVKERIRAEELFRATLQPREDKSRWWGLLNGLIGGTASIVLAGLCSILWAPYQERETRVKDLHVAFQRLWDLDRELDYRLMGYHYTLDNIRIELEPLVKAEREGKTPQDQRTTKEIRRALSRAYDELDTPKRPAYQECRELGLYGLLAQAELASQNRFDDRLPKYGAAKAAVFALRHLNDRMQDLERFSEINSNVLVIDAFLKRPGLGEWYHQPGLNSTPGFYQSRDFLKLVSHLEARGEGFPKSLIWIPATTAVLVGTCVIGWLVYRKYGTELPISDSPSPDGIPPPRPVAPY